MRTAAKHEVALRPLLSHATDHYYRLYLRLQYGAGRADKALKDLAYAYFCKACAARGLLPAPPGASCPACGEAGVRWGGPLWGGPLFDPEFLADVERATHGRPLGKPQELAKALAVWREEAVAPPLLYDVHEIAPRAGVDVPRTEALLAALRERGFTVTRTHLHGRGIKTDATAAQLVDVMRGIPPRAQSSGS